MENNRIKPYKEFFESKGRPKYTAIEKAIFNDDINKLRSLLEAGENPNVDGIDDWRPIHYASMQSFRLPMLKMLIDAGADVNVKTNTGDTPINIASIFASPESVKALLIAGANLFDVRSFSSIESFLDYFDGDISWWHNIPNSVLRMLRSNDLFGEI